MACNDSRCVGRSKGAAQCRNLTRCSSCGAAGGMTVRQSSRNSPALRQDLRDGKTHGRVSLVVDVLSVDGHQDDRRPALEH